MKIAYSERARQDIDRVLETSAELFGEDQAYVYADLLKRAVALASSDPSRPSSRDRSDLMPGLRSLHVSLAARSRRRASHEIFYRVLLSDNGDACLEIVRVLHQSMNAAAHIAASVSGEAPE